MRDDHEIDDDLVDIEPEVSSYIIYHRTNGEEEIPSGFNAVTIPIDLLSNHSWENKEQDAINFIERGYHLFFDLNLELPKKLRFPIFDILQFETISLCLDYFLKSVYLKFKEHTKGIIIGSISTEWIDDLSNDSSYLLDFNEWLEEKKDKIADYTTSQLNDIEKKYLFDLYSRDIISEFVELIRLRIPNNIPTILILNAKNCKSPLFFGGLTSQKCLGKTILAIESPPFPTGSMVFNEGSDFGGFIGKALTKTCYEKEVNVGIVLPSLYIDYKTHCEFDKFLGYCFLNQISFKVIDEEFINSEWSGLDYIIASLQGTSKLGKRALQGFSAAGGEIIYIEEAMQDYSKLLTYSEKNYASELSEGKSRREINDN